MKYQPRETGFEHISKVLIVDDDATDRYILRRALVAAMPYCEISETFSGAEAMYLLNARAAEAGTLPDLIFLDMNMPGMSGTEFLDAFGEFSARIPNRICIVVVSAIFHEDEKKRAMAHEHVKGYFTKPISLEIMLRLPEYCKSKESFMQA
jgi:CheY-like chemotaxis protein